MCLTGRLKAPFRDMEDEKLNNIVHMSQHYELLYVIPGSVTDEDLPAVKTKISDLVKASGANVTQEQDLGRKKLAYKVGQHHQGVYVLIDLDAEPEATKKINTQLQLSQEVLRFLLTQKEVEPAEVIAARAKLRESIQAKRQEKMAKEVGRAMAKAQAAKAEVAKKEKAEEKAAMASTPADLKAVEKELDKLMSDEVKL